MNQTVSLNSVSARFTAAANTYDDLSAVQCAVAEKLAASIAANGRIDSILEAGCGTGALTGLLLRRFRHAAIDAVDIAEGMIEAARSRFAGCAKIRWHVADARHFSSESRFALVASSSALHWMMPLSGTIERFAGLLAPGGRLVSALMAHGTFEELNETRQRLFPEKPARVDLPRTEEVIDAIAGAGLTMVTSSEEVLQARFDSANAFLKSLNRQGVTGCTNGGSALLNRTELRRLAADYDHRFAHASGGVFATYRVLYFQARKSTQ
jgi:malonyl-CoA O-methyltransferase